MDRKANHLTYYLYSNSTEEKNSDGLAVKQFNKLR